MRILLILSASSLITAAFPLQTSQGSTMFAAFLRDIADEDRTAATIAESTREVEGVLASRSHRAAADGSEDFEQCRKSCVDESAIFESLCDRHIRADAPRSRAVCYLRVDEDRDQCMADCEE